MSTASLFSDVGGQFRLKSLSNTRTIEDYSQTPLKLREPLARGHARIAI